MVAANEKSSELVLLWTYALAFIEVNQFQVSGVLPALRPIFMNKQHPFLPPPYPDERVCWSKRSWWWFMEQQQKQRHGLHAHQQRFIPTSSSSSASASSRFVCIHSRG